MRSTDIKITKKPDKDNSFHQVDAMVSTTGREGLLRCPSCGSNRIELKRNFDRIQCMFCGVTGPWFDGHSEDAISGWNTMPRRVGK